jgi:tetratricopeptide (TPR) repeat protein
MNLRDCYRLLELPPKATIADVKAAYRRLARRYHPDVSPDPESQERFIRVTAAYRQIMDQWDPATTRPSRPAPPAPQAHTSVRTRPVRPKTATVPKAPKVQFNPLLSEFERELKEKSFQRLQKLFAGQRLPSAIALVEGLAQRIPHDPEIVQWQAIAYHRWARQLIDRHDFDKARVYLKKALRLDPHNRTLWVAVEQEFRRIEAVF